ncbi:hypothetical protein BGHDH14_bgh04914 [Blumeria hordei DH14]|uniref:F-box domain-containing protein n=1 Tax=Blumeria graminis f. sp. hordei (strain DH14) TaxID=546991 RepID=N1J6P9_BLUG1|nr:hypothetical protein BGHDH14_bgh04914 [Blumeria hordei DH14]
MTMNTSSVTSAKHWIQEISLESLPSEILLQILSYLDIPDLLSISRTMHLLRSLTHDPLLHSHRLQRASLNLSRAIPTRPPLTELMARRVYITRNTRAALSLGRKFIMIKLNRQLGRRPNIQRLVELGVMPEEFLEPWTSGDNKMQGRILMKKIREKERVKCFLREWIAKLGRKVLNEENKDKNIKLSTNDGAG